jgi:hypothetical protein
VTAVCSGVAPAGCHNAAAPEGNGARVASRLKYQKTKAPCSSASTINNQTMDTSMPGGTDIHPTRLGAPSSRGPVFTAAGSLEVVSKVVVPERMPENLPAQPRQYRALSLLGVWHASQNLVIPGGQDGWRYGMGMNFVTITSELITTQKAAKSSAQARCGTTRDASDRDAFSAGPLLA